MKYTEFELPNIDGLPSVDAIDTMLAEKSLAEFSKQAWHVVEPGIRYVHNWHIDAICEHLEAIQRGQLRNLVITMPPRHMKSILVSVNFFCHTWINRPNLRLIYASYAASLAIRDSLKCRRLLDSDWFKTRWGNRVVLQNDQNQKARFENTSLGYRIATSVDGSATGEGADGIVIDDPHNIKEKDSAIRIEAVLEWHDQVMSTRLNDPKKGFKILVMQRVAQTDLVGHILKQGGYEHLNLPAEFEPEKKCFTSIGWSDPRTQEGELLWPARLDKLELSKLKNSLGEIGFATQFNQRPAPKGGARFKSQWFRNFTHTVPGRNGLVCQPHDYNGEYHLEQKQGGLYNVSPSSCKRFAVVDPAGTDKEQNSKACYTAIGIFAETPKKDLILLHMQRAQLDIPSCVEMIVEVCRKYKVAWVGIEKNGLGLGVCKKVAEKGLAVRPILAEGPKEARTETAEIRLQGGQIYFPHTADWLKDFVEELLFFPNSTNKDQVDVLAHAAILVATKTLKLHTDSIPFALN